MIAVKGHPKSATKNNSMSGVQNLWYDSVLKTGKR
jgi:hypothetical protein